MLRLTPVILSGKDLVTLFPGPNPDGANHRADEDPYSFSHLMKKQIPAGMSITVRKPKKIFIPGYG
jgi:hypothetical protein